MSSAGRHTGRLELLPSDGPLRRPGSTQEELTRRAWRLTGLHLLIPGSAQLVAGSRLVGRIAIGVWAVLIAVVAAALLTWLVAAELLVRVVTSAFGLTVLQIGLLLVAVGWLALTIDTLRLSRVLRLRPWARPLVALSLVLLAGVGSGVAAYGAYLSGVARGALVSVFAASGPAASAASDTSLSRYDVLLVGMDRPAKGGALRPESVSLASIDARTGAVTLIALPVTIENVPFPASSPMHRLYPDGYHACIAAPCTLADVYTEAQTVGRALYPDAATSGVPAGIAALRDAVTGSTGRPIEYSVQIDTSAFGRLVDALGGVRIGGHELNGAAVVQYLQAGARSDGIGGATRTLQVETALLQQANPANVLLQFRSVAAASSGAIRTDVPQGTATDLAVIALKAQGRAVRQLSLAPPAVKDLKDPDWAAVHRLVAAAIG